MGALGASDSLDALVSTARKEWSSLDWAAMGALVLLALSAISAAWSVRPRLKNTQPRGFIFWENIKAHQTDAEFHSSLARQSEADLDRHLAGHLHILATVTSRKFYWSAWAVLLAMAGGVLTGAVLVFP